MKFIQMRQKLVGWVYEHAAGMTEFQKNKDIPLFLRRFDEMLNLHGPEWTIKRIKMIRLMLVRYLAGSPIVEKSVKTNSHGLPTGLPLMRSLIAKDKKAIVIVMTLLSLSRTIKWWPKEADYTPVISETTSSLDLFKKGQDLGAVLKNKGVNFGLGDWTSFHTSYSKGPNGPAVISSILELRLLPKCLRESIYILGGEVIKMKMESLMDGIKDTHVEAWKDHFGLSTAWIRKISHIRDPEGKLRIICMFDYWSQTVLKPLHDIIFRVLRKIPNDCTFEQSKGLKRSGPHFCFDLSNATDRFPAELQSGLLSVFIGEDKAKAWLRIMTSYDVQTPEGKSVKYITGQPMGAYSSWAVFTLSHHAVLQFISQNKNWETNYSLLGDDIVIHDAKLAAAYLKFMESLGVEINEQKSIVSDNMIEFAKRHFLDCQEVSSISMKGLMSVHKKWTELSGFLLELEQRGVVKHSSRAVKELLSFSVSPGFATRLTKKVEIGRLFSLIRENEGDVTDYCYKALQLLDFDLGCNRYNFSKNYLLEVIAAHHLIGIQNSMFSTQEELVNFANLLKSEAFSTMPTGHPPYVLLLDKSNSLHQEGRQLSEIIEKQDWQEIVGLEFEWFPSPKRLLSKTSKPDSTGAKSLVNKLLVFFKEEKKQFVQELACQ